MTAPTLKQPAALAPAQDLACGIKSRARSFRVGRQLTPLLLLTSDFAATNLSFYFAWCLRYGLMLGGDVEPFDLVGYDVYFPLGLAFSGLVIIIFFLGSLYRRQQAAFWLNDFFAILGRCAIAVMALVAFSTMFRSPASSRLTFIYAWPLATGLTTAGRVLVQYLTGLLHKRGIATERVVVVGDDTRARMVMQGIAAQPHLGLKVVGFLAGKRAEDFGRFRYLGPVAKVGDICGDHRIDQVIVALPSTSHDLQLGIVEHCRRAGVTFRLVPDLFEMSPSRIDLDTVSGVPLIGLKEVSIEGSDLFLKRCLDITLTTIALVAFIPLLLSVALLVRLDSPGPIIFRQTRVGKGGRDFTLYKFRSMRDGAELELDQVLPLNEQQGPIFKRRDDPRMTRVGRVIRRASLDELPQLFNVLNGDMSLVGPRPPLPSEVAKYEAWHLKRLQVAPGITGLWQVSGRSSLNFEEMVVFDLAYIQNWSVSLDLSILLRTVPAVLAGGGAF